MVFNDCSVSMYAGRHLLYPLLTTTSAKTHRTLAAIRDTAASVGASDSSGRATNRRYQRVHSHTSNKHTGVQCAPFHIWQSLKTPRQIVKIASSSESYDEDDNLVGLLLLLLLLLFCCWFPCWRVKKRPTKDERFAVELTLKYRPCLDRSSSPLRLL